MKRNLLISAILSLTITGAHAGINPFKPYMPLTELDYAYNWSVGHDSTSIAYKPGSLTQRALLPIGMLSTGILLNDNELDKRIKKEGKLSSTPLKSADFLQFSPAGILYILKIAGVQSRNDWPRMLTAHGTAAVIQFGLTRSIKNINDRVFRCNLYDEYGNSLNVSDIQFSDLSKYRAFKMDNLDAPSYAHLLKDGTCRVIWRDVLNNGFSLSDSSIEEYPFTNGAFYINKRIDLYVRRQDPHNEYGLYDEYDLLGLATYYEDEDNYVKEPEIEC